MSTPSGPRRRRIAGERRSEITPPNAQPTLPEVPSSAPAKVELLKPPPSSTGPYTPATPPPPASADIVDWSTPDAPRQSATPAGWWGGGLSLTLLTGLLVVLVTLLALGLLGVLRGAGFDGLPQRSEASATQDAGRAASSTAERAAVAILSYNYKTLDADLKSATDFMTARQADEYTKTFAVVRDPATAAQATVTAVVQGSGVLTATQSTARILLFVDQTTQSTNFDGPQLALNRVELLMKKDPSGSWLVDSISSY